MPAIGARSFSAHPSPHVPLSQTSLQGRHASFLAAPAGRLPLTNTIIIKPFACSSPLESPAEDAPWKSWIVEDDSSASLSRFQNPSMLGVSQEGMAFSAKCALQLLYRALLIGGLGLSFSAPALADPSSSEVLVDKLVEESVQKTNEKEAASQRVVEPQKPENFESLDDDFWNALRMSEDSVERLLKDYLDVHPTNVPALGFLAQMLLENKDMKNALKVLDKVEQLDPSDTEWKFLKARAYSLTNQLELARKAYEDILKVEPFSARVLQRLAMVLDRMDGKNAGLELMKASFAKAVEENKIEEARNVRITIGQYHTLKGNYEEAIQIYKEMMSELPDDFRLYLCQGIIYSVLGEIDKAEELFQKYEQLCPEDCPDREIFDGYMSRAKREGQKVADLKKEEKGDSTEGKGTEYPSKGATEISADNNQ